MKTIENVVFDSRVTQTFVNGKLVFNEGEFDSKLQGRRLTFER